MQRGRQGAPHLSRQRTSSAVPLGWQADRPRSSCGSSRFPARRTIGVASCEVSLGFRCWCPNLLSVFRRAREHRILPGSSHACTTRIVGCASSRLPVSFVGRCWCVAARRPPSGSPTTLSNPLLYPAPPARPSCSPLTPTSVPPMHHLCTTNAPPMHPPPPTHLSAHHGATRRAYFTYLAEWRRLLGRQVEWLMSQALASSREEVGLLGCSTRALSPSNTLHQKAASASVAHELVCRPSCWGGSPPALSYLAGRAHSRSDEGAGLHRSSRGGRRVC